MQTMTNAAKGKNQSLWQRVLHSLRIKLKTKAGHTLALLAAAGNLVGAGTAIACPGVAVGSGDGWNPSGPTYSFIVEGTVGEVITLKTSTDLQTWTSAGTITIPAGGFYHFSENVSGVNKKFYSV